jgi:hypothetical protein
MEGKLERPETHVLRIRRMEVNGSILKLFAGAPIFIVGVLIPYFDMHVKPRTGSLLGSHVAFEFEYFSLSKVVQGSMGLSQIPSIGANHCRLLARAGTRYTSRFENLSTSFTLDQHHIFVRMALGYTGQYANAAALLSCQDFLV